MQALLDAQKRGVVKSGEIAVVISDRAGAYALVRAEENKVPCYCLNKKELGRKLFEEKALEVLRKHETDLVVLAGFLSVLSGEFVKAYAGRILNVHPSLIPAFCGKGFYGIKVHQEVIKSGVKITGATVHLVNEIPDGGEIICQKAVRVRKNDTPESLQKRVMEQAEWKILPTAVEKAARGALRKKCGKLKNI